MHSLYSCIFREFLKICSLHRHIGICSLKYTRFWRRRFSRAESAGVKKEKIIIDPGIGFGKSLEDNYRIIQNISYFRAMGFPVLIGLSHKSLIGKLYDAPVDRLPGTIALNTAAVLAGAEMIRVHDVKAHRLACDVLEKTYDG